MTFFTNALTASPMCFGKQRCCSPFQIRGRQIRFPIYPEELTDLSFLSDIPSSQFLWILGMKASENLVFSIILTYTNIDEKVINPVIMIVTAISILLGSSLGNIKIKKNGLINGGTIGAIYICLLYTSPSPRDA